MTEFKPIGSIPGYEELSHEMDINGVLRNRYGHILKWQLDKDEDDTEPQEEVLAYRDRWLKSCMVNSPG